MAIKPFSRQNFASKNFNVINATPVATYSLSSLAASYNEGDTITITIATGFIVDGTVLYWTTSGTSTSADFSDGVTSGSVTITNNTGTVTRTLLSDLATEGTETFVFELRTGSTSGPIVATTSSSDVLDTSISPKNYSVQFNGSSQNLSVAANSAFNLGTNNFTIEAWIYPTALPTSGNISNILAQYDNGLAVSTTAFLFALYNNTGTMQLLMQPTSGSTQTVISGTYAFAVNTWYHVAVVRNSNNIYLYVNGVQVGTTTAYSSSINTSSTALTIASRLSSGASELRFSGYISNFRFVNGTAVYTAAFTPSTVQLTAITNTSLLTCRSATIADASTNAFTITNTGTALVSGENPFGNYSMSFNGSSHYLSIPANTAFRQDQGDWTVECWVRINSLSVLNTIASMGNYSSAHNFLLFIGTDGSIRYEAGNGSWGILGPDVGSSAGVIAVNTWYHIAWVRNGTTLKMYVNGIEVFTQASALFGVGATNLLYIGNYFNYDYPLNGFLSNFRIVKGTAVYTANFTSPTAPLSAITNTQLLVAQYPELFDASTNHFTVTNSSTTPAITANPFDNYAYAFNGSSQNLSVASNAALTLTADFTVECFAYATTTTNAVDQVFNYGNFAFMLYHNGTTWTVEIGNGTSNYFTLSGTASLNAWHHFAITRSGNTYTFWIDGASAATTSNANAPSTNSTLYIGTNPANTQRFTGYISNFRVVKGTAVYTAAFTPSTSPLSAISGTSLLTAQYATLFDASTNNFAITPTGAPPAVATNLFVAPNNLKNYSGKFNGSTQLLNATNAAFAPGTGDFTIECWAFYTGTADNNGIFHLTSSIFPNAVSGLAAAFGASGQFYVYFGGSSNTTTGSYTKNTWVHIALVRASGVTKFYVNGTGITISASDATNYSGGALVIGGYYSTTYLMVGYISNFRIVKGTALYTSTFTPSATPLLPVSGTSLLTLQSNRIYDSGPNQFTLTNSGSTTMAYLSPFST